MGCSGSRWQECGPRAPGESENAAAGKPANTAPRSEEGVPSPQKREQEQPPALVTMPFVPMLARLTIRTLDPEQLRKEVADLKGPDAAPAALSVTAPAQLVAEHAEDAARLAALTLSLLGQHDLNQQIDSALTTGCLEKQFSKTADGEVQASAFFKQRLVGLGKLGTLGDMDYELQLLRDAFHAPVSRLAPVRAKLRDNQASLLSSLVLMETLVEEIAAAAKDTASTAPGVAPLQSEAVTGTALRSQKAVTALVELLRKGGQSLRNIGAAPVEEDDQPGSPRREAIGSLAEMELQGVAAYLRLTDALQDKTPLAALTALLAEAARAPEQPAERAGAKPAAMNAGLLAPPRRAGSASPVMQVAHEVCVTVLSGTTLVRARLALVEIHLDVN